MIRWIATRLGYVSAAEARESRARFGEASFQNGHKRGYQEGRDSYMTTVQDGVRLRCGEIEAERNGYRAQWEQAERRLRVANRRLQQADLMPVTSFV